MARQPVPQVDTGPQLQMVTSMIDTALPGVEQEGSVAVVVPDRRPVARR
jgi:hypothetical protein